MRPEDLPQQWLEDAAVLTPDAGPELWSAEGDLLLTGWFEPHRAYHTVAHLAEVFTVLDTLTRAGAITGEQARVGRLAGWYHDLAYDPRAAPGSNEHRSAALARDHLHLLGAEDSLVDEVEALVLLTVDHDDGPAGHAPLAAAFHDADLWILSAPRDRYEDYRVQVRREYAHVPDELFATGRARILRGFAGRDRLYRTAYAHERWTDSARANLQRELAALTGPPATYES